MVLHITNNLTLLSLTIFTSASITKILLMQVEEPMLGPISSVETLYAANYWDLGLIPVLVESLGLMLDCCFNDLHLISVLTLRLLNRHVQK